MKQSILFVLAIALCLASSDSPGATEPAPGAVPIASLAAAPALSTGTFIVPLGYFSSTPSATRDPFGNPVHEPVEARIRARLESLGISFAAVGSTVAFNAGSARLTVTNTTDQLDKLASLMMAASGDGSLKEGVLQVEAFSMPGITARKSLIAHPKESALYAWLDAEQAKPEPAAKLERHTVMRIRSGLRAQSQSIIEAPQATEFDPPQIPNVFNLTPNLAATVTTPGGEVFAPWPHTAVTPQAVEVTMLGWTIDAEAVFSDNGEMVDLKIEPFAGRRVGIEKFGLARDQYQPVFETRTYSAMATLRIGVPALISTFSPPVNTGVPGGNQEDRTWLLFVTVTRPE